VILNGHEYVVVTAQDAGMGFAKEGNCFTRVDEPDRLAQIADTLSQPGTIGRLSQVIDCWICTACLCFGLDLDEQRRSGFGYGYAYSVYQVEYSRNLIFESGRVMERAFDIVVDRTRSRIDGSKLRALFGVGQRPCWRGVALSPRRADLPARRQLASRPARRRTSCIELRRRITPRDLKASVRLVGRSSRPCTVVGKTTGS
jgi:hypothetical protein